MKKVLLIAIILLLLALDWAALHDILKGDQPSFYLKYGLLAFSLIIFAGIAYFKIKKPPIPNKPKILLYFTILFLIISALISLWNKNYEFLYYTAVLSILIIIIILHHKKFHIPSSIIIGLSIISILHVLGNNLYINQTRLFDFYLIPNLFKYDNLIHFCRHFHRLQFTLSSPI